MSSVEDPKSAIRYSMLDNYGMINEDALQKNAHAISDAILSTIYQSTVSIMTIK